MVTITFNSTDYDAYANITTADLYLQTDAALANSWGWLTQLSKNRALITSSRYLNSLPWKGVKTSDTQPLAWPRTNTGVDGVTDNVIPEDVINGSIIYAALVANDPDILSTSTQDDNTKRLKAGSVEIEFFRYQDGPVVVKRLFDLIGKYLSGQSNIAVVFNTTGTQEPRFDEDAFGLNEGY